jgi:hypothetical protein
MIQQSNLKLKLIDTKYILGKMEAKENKQQLSMFDNITYTVIVYADLAPPHSIAIVIESIATTEYKSLKIDDNLHVFKKMWTFEGPRKAVYASIMGVLFRNKITPQGGIVQHVNPNNKMLYNVDNTHLNSVVCIIDEIVKALTFNFVTKNSEYVVVENLDEMKIEDAINEGVLFRFTKAPTALILPSGPPSRKSKPVLLQLRADVGNVVSANVCNAGAIL